MPERIETFSEEVTPSKNSSGQLEGYYENPAESFLSNSWKPFGQSPQKVKKTKKFQKSKVRQKVPLDMWKTVLITAKKKRKTAVNSTLKVQKWRKKCIFLW